MKTPDICDESCRKQVCDPTCQCQCSFCAAHRRNYEGAKMEPTILLGRKYKLAQSAMVYDASGRDRRVLFSLPPGAIVRISGLGTFGGASWVEVDEIWQNGSRITLPSTLWGRSRVYILRACFAHKVVTSEEEQFKMDENRFQEIRDRMVDNVESHFGKDAFNAWGVPPETVKEMLNSSPNLAQWGLRGNDVVELVNNCAYIAQQIENEGACDGKFHDSLRRELEELQAGYDDLVQQVRYDDLKQQARESELQEKIVARDEIITGRYKQIGDLQKEVRVLKENLSDADEEYMALIEEQKTKKARIAELELLISTNPDPLPEETVSDDPLYNSHDNLETYKELQMKEQERTCGVCNKKLKSAEGVLTHQRMTDCGRKLNLMAQQGEHHAEQVRPKPSAAEVRRSNRAVVNTVAEEKRRTAIGSFKYTAYQSVLQTLIRWSGAAFIAYHIV